MTETSLPIEKELNNFILSHQEEIDSIWFNDLENNRPTLPVKKQPWARDTADYIFALLVSSINKDQDEIEHNLLQLEACSLARIACWLQRLVNAILTCMAQHQDVSSRHKICNFLHQVLIIITLDLLYMTEGQKEQEIWHRLGDLRSAFFASLSHELKTPLTIIDGYISLFKENRFGEVNTRQQDALDIVARQASILRHKIDDLLDISALETGQVTINMSPLDLNLLVHAKIDIAREGAKLKNIHWEEKLEPDLKPVLGDADRLGHVLREILDNALQFTPSGGTIRVSTSLQDDMVEVTVEDSGPGMSPRERKQVFSALFHLERPLSRNEGGIGVGLSLCHYIILAHHGKIWIEAAEEGGTRVRFAIPLRPTIDKRG